MRTTRETGSIGISMSSMIAVDPQQHAWSTLGGMIPQARRERFWKIDVDAHVDDELSWNVGLELQIPGPICGVCLFLCSSGRYQILAAPEQLADSDGHGSRHGTAAMRQAATFPPISCAPLTRRREPAIVLSGGNDRVEDHATLCLICPHARHLSAGTGPESRSSIVRPDAFDAV